MFSLIDMLGRRAPHMKVVDVGAMWLGADDPPYGALTKAGKCDVIGFEPQQNECDKLNKMGLKRQSYLPYFIGDGSKRTFHLTSAPMTSSLYEPNTSLLNLFQLLHELTTTVSTSSVTTKRLDDIPEIAGTDYLKLDVQGAEADCLRGGTQLLRNCAVVYTEVNFVPMYKDMALFGDVDALMRENGFLLHWLEPTQNRCYKPFMVNNSPVLGLNQTIWSNAVYVKDFTRLGRQPVELLLKMAVIVHECFNSFDLAAHALRYYDAKVERQGGVKAKDGLWPLYVKRVLGEVPNMPPILASELVDDGDSTVEIKPAVIAR